MLQSTITGIDIGTNYVKVVICDAKERTSKNNLKILGVGISEARGLRHGYVVNTKDATRSLIQAIQDAEKKAQVKVKKSFVAVGGIGLESITSTSSVIISRADLEITELDIDKVQDQCEKDIPQNLSLNRKIIHSIPVHFKIDGKVVLGKPEGMRGSKLEVKTLYITCLEQQLNDFIQVVEDAGVSVQDVMASPIAGSLVILNKSQKIAGCVLVNIGSETVSIAIFENGKPISLEVFPIGSTDITNDIALGLKVPIEEAEQIKIGAITGSSYPRKKLDEIVSARLSDVFELVENHLKKIGRNGLLPAGAIMTGGGSNLSNIEEITKVLLKLPAKVGSINLGYDKQNSRDSLWAVAYGLCVFGTNADEDMPIDTTSVLFNNLKKKVINWLKQFLP